MLATLQEIIYMNGYGGYVWSAYISVFVLLLAQWFIPWRRWKKYLREQTQSS